MDLTCQQAYNVTNHEIKHSVKDASNAAHSSCYSTTPTGMKCPYYTNNSTENDHLTHTLSRILSNLYVMECSVFPTTPAAAPYKILA